MATDLDHSIDEVTGIVQRLDEIVTLLRSIDTHLASLRQEAGQESHLPEECRKHECSYYQHYLAYGGPDLTHEGYHAAEKLAAGHFESCSSVRHDRGPCSLCISYEQRLRA